MHPDLLPPLARLISQASATARIWIVTHSDLLARSLEAEIGHRARRVIKVNGATQLENLNLAGEYLDEVDA